jgi:flagellar hook assembly protein FlgD
MNNIFRTSNPLLLLTIIFIFPFLFSNLSAQNSGTLNFSVTTNRTFLNYDPKNIMAIWVTDESDNFVQTLKKRANNREQYLYTWIASTNRNTVNAITGSTLSSHQTHNVTWNCQNINGITVPNGWYKIRCEYTTRHAQGPWTPVDYIMFYKGGDIVDTTFNNYNFNNQLAYSNITLVYNPNVTSVEDEGNNQLTTDFHLYPNYPNPFNPSTTIEFEVPELGIATSFTRIVIYNSMGQLIRTLYNGYAAVGRYQVNWDGKDENNINQASGVYYIQLISGNIKQSQKMILLR